MAKPHEAHCQETAGAEADPYSYVMAPQKPLRPTLSAAAVAEIPRQNR